MLTLGGASAVRADEKAIRDIQQELSDLQDRLPKVTKSFDYNNLNSQTPVYQYLKALEDGLNEYLSKLNGNLHHLKGDRGEPGQDGRDGQPGPQGPAGKDGQNGKDGLPGKDGKDGQDGKAGQPGKPAPKTPEVPQKPDTAPHTPKKPQIPDHSKDVTPAPQKPSTSNRGLNKPQTQGGNQLAKTPAAHDTHRQLPATGETTNPFFTAAAVAIMTTAGVVAVAKRQENN
ncbi:LPXTG-motif cell wall anchor domain-containing protein [Streptococcus pyogenes]|uniref:LPXTG-anchored collagen-like adhesin Scl2/SclB n=1 Tax=Streptococcus pyogenes TaxID=1314 RepID=UPI000DA2736C|nr:LPXTG-anchored collagen-like adhesin Scl2/SclB [Streptococcus pyogenes]SQF03571.1 LPXTG-motif cell wall anchor domain-containing protein [Streptococcus pyogenes]